MAGFVTWLVVPGALSASPRYYTIRRGLIQNVEVPAGTLASSIRHFKVKPCPVARDAQAGEGGGPFLQLCSKNFTIHGVW